MSAYDSSIRTPSKKPAKSRKTENVGETSVEIDVENLITELEEERSSGVDSSGELRKRLDEILDRKRTLHEIRSDLEDLDIDS
jgi:hypothetical protein